MIVPHYLMWVLQKQMEDTCINQWMQDLIKDQMIYGCMLVQVILQD